MNDREPTQEDCDNCFGAERYHQCKYFTKDNECIIPKTKLCEYPNCRQIGEERVFYGHEFFLCETHFEELKDDEK